MKPNKRNGKSHYTRSRYRLFHKILPHLNCGSSLLALQTIVYVRVELLFSFMNYSKNGTQKCDGFVWTVGKYYKENMWRSRRLFSVILGFVFEHFDWMQLWVCLKCFYSRILELNAKSKIRNRLASTLAKHRKYHSGISACYGIRITCSASFMMWETEKSFQFSQWTKLSPTSKMLKCRWNSFQF